MTPTMAALCLVAGGWIGGLLIGIGVGGWIRKRQMDRASDKKVQPITYARKRSDWGGGKSA